MPSGINSPYELYMNNIEIARKNKKKAMEESKNELQNRFGCRESGNAGKKRK